MLEHLGGEFDEIAPHRGAGLRWVADLAEQTVQPMAEFVEQGARVIEAQERRIALGEIVVVDDDREHVAVEHLLLAIAAHPGTGMLAGPREIVVQKEADRTVRRVAYLIGAHIRMVERAVMALDKAEPEQASGAVERRCD